MNTKRKISSSLKRLLLTLIYLCLVTAVSACSQSTQANNRDNGPLKVTTTIGMIADVVKQVGGEHVEVTGLMKSGVDPHLYKASQGDIRKLDQADIIFYNGLHLEGKMVEIFENMAKKKAVFAVSDNIDPGMLRNGGPSFGDQYDPHIWFDVRLWVKATEKIRDDLANYDPIHAEVYKINADHYIMQLEELHAYAKEQIASIPEMSRVLVTAHDAFGYFGEAYDIKVMALQGMSTASEAGVKDVTGLRDYLVAKKIKAVFTETSVPPKYIEAVIQGAKEKGHTVNDGGDLFSDAMGQGGTAEGTYIGMVKHNVDTIVMALK